MLKEYGEFYKTYSEQYGKKTAIFLMVGSFYELYDEQNAETGETKFNVKDIIDILGIELKTKKEEGTEGYYTLFAGFPDYVLHKWAGRLTSVGWTVIVVDQIKAGTKVVDRKVSRILSPSTHIELMSSNETPYLVSLFLKVSDMAPPTYGVSSLDLTTGHTATFHGQAIGRKDIWTADTLTQFLTTYFPKEMNIYILNPSSEHSSSIDNEQIRRTLGLPSATIPIFFKQISSLDAFKSELTRKETLQNAYNIRSLLPPKTFLGLRTEEEELSLLYLIQTAEQHMPSSKKAFHRNEPWSPQLSMICGNHALLQLQMAPSSPATLNESVLSLFSSCLTPMGKRAIRDRLLRPSCISSIIERRLQEVDAYLEWLPSHKQNLDRQLRFLSDVPRLHRKILISTIEPFEFSNIIKSYEVITKIKDTITNNTLLESPITPPSWSSYMEIVRRHIDLEKSLQISEDITPFAHSHYKETIAITENKIKHVLQQIEQLRKDITSSVAGLKDDSIRLEKREKEPYGLKASNTNLKLIQSAKLQDVTVTLNKSGGWIESTELTKLNNQLVKLREQLQQQSKEATINACDDISKAGEKIWSELEDWICLVDCTQCIGKTANERGFSRPTILNTPSSLSPSSGLRIKSLRHPLVESLSSRVSYVHHDVSLGMTDDENAWLVYGMNASGKSTLMKAIGLAVILAQAGSYVPAETMELIPFTAVYTRILNNDNLFAGLSSFAVEMSELRDILRSADNNSLVLGDELCAGTESVSAQALVAAGMKWLSKKKSKFVFATHLHELPQLLNTEEMGLKVWHLHVDYNPHTKKLVYDRSLRPGSGSTLYGLEVARAMDLPSDFITDAHDFRNRLTGTKNIQDAPSSAWNSQITRHKCEICGNPVQRDLEVHHIRERASAKKGDKSVHNVSNLVVLCEICHDKHHAGELEIGGIISTSDGPQRIINDNSTISAATNTTTNTTTTKNKTSVKSKWTNEQLDIIEEYIKSNTNMSAKTLSFKLENEKGIIISASHIGKLRAQYYE